MTDIRPGESKPNRNFTKLALDGEQKNANVASALCVATAPSLSFADTFTWTGGGADKNWSTAANWSPSGTMTSSDTANFQTGTLSTDSLVYDSGAFAGITV